MLGVRLPRDVEAAPGAAVHDDGVAPDGGVLCALLGRLRQPQCAQSVAREAVELSEVQQAAGAAVVVLPRVRVLRADPQQAVSAVEVVAGGRQHRGRAPQQFVLWLCRQQLVPGERREGVHGAGVGLGSACRQLHSRAHGGGARLTILHPVCLVTEVCVVNVEQWGRVFWARLSV